MTAVDDIGQKTSSDSVQVTTPGESAMLVDADKSWRWRFAATAPASDWRDAGFNDSAWSSGKGPFGFGSSLVDTDISIGAPSPRPLSAQFRTTFQVSDVNALDPATLTFVADDGVVVHVNGVEVHRQNLPTGTIAWNTYATAAPRSANTNASPVVISLPASALKDGANVITAQTHLNYRSTPDSLFKLTLSAPPLDEPTPIAPSVPGWGTPDWQDEFTGTKVDPTKWNVRDRSNLGLTMDSAIPDAGQVSVNSGILHLKGDWLPETQTRTTSATGVNVLTHKTGYLDQRKIQSDNVYRGQRWGRWEIRAKTPTGTNTMGALAAFWLRNANSGEIDIMEAWGYGTAMPTAGKVMQDNAATTIHTKTDGTGVKRLWRHTELGSTSARPRRLPRLRLRADADLRSDVRRRQADHADHAGRRTPTCGTRPTSGRPCTCG